MNRSFYTAEELEQHYQEFLEWLEQKERSKEGPVLPEGDTDYDQEDNRVYREELNERPRPSEY